MSIYGSLEAPCDDLHDDDCARWEKHGNVWEISDRPCDCGQPDAPLVYQGSHILPEETDERGGYVDIAMISPHVRFWRDNPDAPTSWEPDIDTAPAEPFLRFGVNESTVVLTRRNVEMVHASLTEWLRLAEPTESPPEETQ